MADEHFKAQSAPRPAKLVQVCTDCGVEFSFTVRRHQLSCWSARWLSLLLSCRVCGQVFCASCSSKTVAGSALPGSTAAGAC